MPAPRRRPAAAALAVALLACVTLAAGARDLAGLSK